MGSTPATKKDPQTEEVVSLVREVKADWDEERHSRMFESIQETRRQRHSEVRLTRRKKRRRRRDKKTG